jgi:hypothetical protein
MAMQPYQLHSAPQAIGSSSSYRAGVKGPSLQSMQYFTRIAWAAKKETELYCPTLSMVG